MGVLAGARAWRGRYRIAYAVHYHAVRREAAETVRAALEQQRARLASRAAHLVLAREEVPALDRLLQVIAASDFGGLERVLDTRLAEHIEALLREPVAMGRALDWGEWRGPPPRSRGLRPERSVSLRGGAGRGDRVAGRGEVTG